MISPGRIVSKITLGRQLFFLLAKMDKDKDKDKDIQQSWWSKRKTGKTKKKPVDKKRRLRSSSKNFSEAQAAAAAASELEADLGTCTTSQPTTFPILEHGGASNVASQQGAESDALKLKDMILMKIREDNDGEAFHVHLVPGSKIYTIILLFTDKA